MADLGEIGNAGDMVKNSTRTWLHTDDARSAVGLQNRWP